MNVMGATECGIRRIHPHPGNIRETLGDLTELIASIKVHGVVQPLVVQPHPQRHGQFIVLAGHRRLEAAKRAGLDQVPIVVRDGAGTAQAVEIMLVENCQRADLGPVEKAEAMGALLRQGYNQARICRATGLSSATVSYYCSLLELDQSTRDKIRAGQVAIGDAMDAVRRRRKRQRTSTGAKAPGIKWEPDHFTSSHALARKATAMCDAREHTLRRRYGQVACGQCWETVIRADERTAAAVLEGATVAALRPRRPAVATADDAPLPDSLMAPPEVHRERADEEQRGLLATSREARAAVPSPTVIRARVEPGSVRAIGSGPEGGAR